MVGVREDHRVTGLTRADALLLDTCISIWQLLHMRTTITIREELLAEVQKLTGKSGYSDAIVSALEDYVALRKRLALLEDLFAHKTPHSAQRIKSMRRKREWSS
jgi:Arc/MetJ family transcription regulator